MRTLLPSSIYIAIAAASLTPPLLGQRAVSDPVPTPRTWIEMRHVDLHVSERGVLHVQRLHGEVIRRAANVIPTLDDPNSFSIRITSATTRLTGSDLSSLLNDVVFAYRGSPLRNLHVTINGSQLVQTGIMHKGVDIPFTITADLTLAPDGRLRLHPTRVRILGVNGEALLHALGMHLDKLLDLRGSRGATVQGDDIYLDATKVLPPPAIAGRLASVRVVNGEIVQEFVSTVDDTVFRHTVHPDSTIPNFVYFRGGQLRFGRLTMTDTDLQILDADARDPLDLYLQRYARQLVAGYSRTLANNGLQVVMPDYRRVGAMASVAAKP